MDIANIEEIERVDAVAQGRRAAQEILAKEMTKLIHGEVGVWAAESISRALFSGEMSNLTEG